MENQVNIRKKKTCPPKKTVPPKTNPRKKRANHSENNKSLVGGENRVVRETKKKSEAGRRGRGRIQTTKFNMFVLTSHGLSNFFGLVLFGLVLSCLVVSCLVLSCLVWSCLVLPRPLSRRTCCAVLASLASFLDLSASRATLRRFSLNVFLRFFAARSTTSFVALSCSFFASC